MRERLRLLLSKKKRKNQQKSDGCCNPPPPPPPPNKSNQPVEVNNQQHQHHQHQHACHPQPHQQQQPQRASSASSSASSNLRSSKSEISKESNGPPRQTAPVSDVKEEKALDELLDFIEGMVLYFGRDFLSSFDFLMRYCVQFKNHSIEILSIQVKIMS